MRSPNPMKMMPAMFLVLLFSACEDGGGGPIDGNPDGGGDIEPVDECARGTHDCDDHATCTDTADSFTCVCNLGFSGDGRSCTDIDECAIGNGGCDLLSTCTNTPGAFTCGECPAGYTGGGASGCVDIDECATDNGGCGDVTAVTCENTGGGFTCTCNEGYLLVEGACVYTVPHAVASTPIQGAEDVYPSEYFLDPTPGRGVRERVHIHLTFDIEMNTEEATVVLTDNDGLEEPRPIEGTWDETGHVLTAIISPHDDGSTGALFDETTYHLSFASLESRFGTPVNPEDPLYPGAVLTFTTGVRDALINHACIHVENGPLREVTALAMPLIWAPNTDLAHHHYTITMPEGSDVGHTMYMPVATGFFRLYARGVEGVQLETSIIDWDTSEPGPWTAVELEAAPAACYAIGSAVGITHQFTMSLDEDNAYLLRWTTPEDAVQIIVEYAGTEL